MQNLCVPARATRRFAVSVLAMALASASGISHANPADLDLAFGVDGIVRLSVAGGGFNDVIVQPDGRIVAVGMSGSDWLIARFNTDGSLDPGFGSGGARSVTPPTVSSTEQAKAVTLDASGRLLVAGGRYVLRLNTDGSVDAGYGSGGFYTPPLTPTQLGLVISDIAVAGDGGFVLSCGVFGSVPPTYVAAHTSVLKLTAAGIADNSFGSNGFATLTGGLERIYNRTSAVVEWNGHIYVAGGSGARWFSYQSEVVRFTLAGAVDTSFGSNGVLPAFPVIATGNPTNEATELAVQSAGLIVTGAGFALPQGESTQTRRITAAGTLDPSFVAPVFAKGSGDLISGLLVDADDHVIVATPTQATPIIARLLPNGGSDAAFGTGGQRPTPFDGEPAAALAQQADGKYLLAGGEGSNVAYLARLAGTAVIPPEVATTPPAGTTLAASGGRPGFTQSLGVIQFANRGSDALAVSGCSVTPGFDVTAGFPLTITQATPQNVAVGCRMPSTPLASINGTLTCTTNDSDEPQVSFPLQCTAGAGGGATMIPALSTPMQLLLSGLLALLAWAGLRRTRHARG